MYPIVNELKNVTMLFLTDISNSMLLLKSHQGKVQIPCKDSAQFFGIIYVLWIVTRNWKDVFTEVS